MGVASVASSAASSAASNATTSVASSAASNAASQATSSVASSAASKAPSSASLGNAMPSNGLSSGGSPSTGSSLPNNPGIDSPSQKSHSSLPDIEESPKDDLGNNNQGESGNNIDQNGSQSSDNGSQSDDNATEESYQRENPQDIDDGKYHAKNNQEVGPGQKVDENGNVVDTGNKKFTKALAVGAATYFGGVEGGEAANALAKTDAGNKLTGVVGDTLDKAPGVGKITEDLGDSGAADAIMDAADTVSAAKSGDIKGTLKSGTSTLKNLGKTVKHYALIIALSLFVVLGPIIMVGVVIAAVCGPVLGGFMDVTSAFGEFVEDVGDFFTGDNDITGTTGGKDLEEVLKDADAMISEVPGYETLAEPRKSIVSAAATGIASGKPYLYGGKPTGPGLSGIPSTGIDCSGFVAWSIWTATGKKPGALGTSTMIDNIGILFEEISESELQPGDIGLKHKNSGSNHTGIYAGNGLWFHAANSRTDLVRSKYNNFTVYLRYKG